MSRFILAAIAAIVEKVHESNKISEMSNVLFFESQNLARGNMFITLRKDVSLNAFLLEEGSCNISETERSWA